MIKYLWQHRQRKGEKPPQTMKTLFGVNQTARPQAQVIPTMHFGTPSVPLGPFKRWPPQNKSLGTMPSPSPAQNGKDVKQESPLRGAGRNAGPTPNPSGAAPPTPAPGAPNSNISRRQFWVPR